MALSAVMLASPGKSDIKNPNWQVPTSLHGIFELR